MHAKPHSAPSHGYMSYSPWYRFGDDVHGRTNAPKKWGAHKE